MMHLLLSFLFLPFAVLGNPVFSVLPAVSPVLSATPTSPEGNSSISGYVNNSTTVNGTNETPVGEDYCPIPSGPHVIPIDIGFAPFTVIGFYDDESLSICIDVNAVVHLAHCAGTLRDDEDVECKIDKGRRFRGDLRLYIKNEHELWIHVDGTIGFIHWVKDIHILNIKGKIVSGISSATPVVTVASTPANLPYSVVASAIAMALPSTNNFLTTPSQPLEVEAS